MSKDADLWGRYPLKIAMAVVHIDDCKKGFVIDDVAKMRVNTILKDPKSKNGTRINGVLCHWLTKDKKIQKNVFHTKELIPWEIASLGLEKIQEWLDRKF